MRLTKKETVKYLTKKLKDKENYYKEIMDIPPDGSDALAEMKVGTEREYNDYKKVNQDEYRYAKLGQLEDIEELCVKMTTQPIYEKFNLSNTHICKLDFIGYNAAYDFKNNCIMIYKGHSATIYSVNEYGKTWALTKEELL